MYAEANRSVENQLLSRQVMIACAAGHVSLDPEELIADPRIYQVNPLQKGIDYVANTPIILPDGSIPTSLARYEETMGWGKTVGQILLSQSLGFGRRAESGGPVLPIGTRSLHLEPTKYLVDQAKEAYARFAPGIILGKDVVVTTYQYAIGAARRGEFTPGQFALIHSDEAHRTLGAVTLHIMNYLQQGTFHFGWSGTPGFSEEKSIANTLPDLIDKTSMRDGMLHRDPKMRFLSGIRIIPLRSGELIDETGSNYLGTDYSERHTKHLAYSDRRNSLILNAALHGLESTHKKGIIKANPGDGQRHAHQLAATLSEIDYPGTHRKINAKVVGATVRDSVQRMKDFCSTNAIDIAIYNEAFREGVDVRELGFGVRGPTLSAVSAAQFMGRGLRPNADGSPFSMYQIIDDVVGRSPVYPWDILGIDHDLESIVVISPSAITIEDLPKEITENRQRSTGSVHPKPSMDPLEVNLTYDNMPTLFFAEAIPPEDLALTSFHIDELEVATGLEQDWLITLLSSVGGMPSTLTVVDGTIRQYYSIEVEEYLRDNVAQEGDLSMVEAAKKLGCTVRTLRMHLSKLEDEIAPIVVYPRVAQIKPAKIQHLTAQQLDLLAEKFPGAEAVSQSSPHITVREVSEKLGKTYATAQAALLRRRFTAYTVPIGGMRGIQQVEAYDRFEVESWLEAYLNAVPAPMTGYTDFDVIRKKHNTIFGNVCRAARSIGLDTPVFIIGNRDRRSEHVADGDQEALEAALIEILISDADRKKQQKNLAAIPAYVEPHIPPTPAAGPKETDKQPTQAATPQHIEEANDTTIKAAKTEQAKEAVERKSGAYPTRKVNPGFSDAELIREGYGIKYFAAVSKRPHVEVGEITYALHPYGGVPPKTIVAIAGELGVRVMHRNGKNFLSVNDADKIVSHYIIEHGTPAASSIPLIELSRKLRCNPLTIGYLLNNHPQLSDKFWVAQLGERLTKDENNVTRVGKTAAQRLTDIVTHAQDQLGSNWVFISSHIVNRSQQYNVYSTFPKHLHDQVRLCDIWVKEGEKVQLIYGTREALRYVMSQRNNVSRNAGSSAQKGSA